MRLEEREGIHYQNLETKHLYKLDLTGQFPLKCGDSLIRGTLRAKRILKSHSLEEYTHYPIWLNAVPSQKMLETTDMMNVGDWFAE